jgi:transcriptional regulator with XRE-family HTH domain
MIRSDILKAKSRELGQNIRRIRMRRDMTQEKLAEGAGITLNYLGIIEIGTKMPSMKVLIQIAEILGVKTKDLIPY